MEIFAATGTKAPPGAKHIRGPLLLAVTELLLFVILPRTYSPKNRLDLPGAGPIHRPLQSRITSSVCSLGKGSPLRSLSSRSRSWLQRPLTSSMYRIRAAFVEEFDLADEEWECSLVSTSTVTVWKQVARIGHRATRDVRRTTEEQALREALQFRPRRGRRRLTLDAFLRHDETSLCSRSPGIRSIPHLVCTPVPQTVSGPPISVCGIT